MELLKIRLLTVYEESETRQVQKLLKEQELDDQKPSQLLRKMRELARSKFSDETLRMLWLGHLPAAVHAVLTVREITDLDKLAAMADKVVESTRYAEISEVSSASKRKQETDLQAQIAKLTRRLSQLERTRPTRNLTRPRSQSRSSSQGRDGISRRNPNWQCYYHFRYKDRANKCIQPCAYKKDDSGSSKN